MRRALPLLLLLASFSAGAKKKPRPPAPAEDALRKVLDGETDAVARCAAPLAAAPGASVDVTAKFMINNRGQIVSCDVTLTISDATAQKCVEEALRSVKFPSSKTALITIARTWRIASQQ